MDSTEEGIHPLAIASVRMPAQNWSRNQNTIAPTIGPRTLPGPPRMTTAYTEKVIAGR